MSKSRWSSMLAMTWYTPQGQIYTRYSIRGCHPWNQYVYIYIYMCIFKSLQNHWCNLKIMDGESITWIRQIWTHMNHPWICSNSTHHAGKLVQHLSSRASPLFVRSSFWIASSNFEALRIQGVWQTFHVLAPDEHEHMDLIRTQIMMLN